MKYILKNLKALIKNEGMIFMIMIVCIISSSLIINFSYGLYQNYNVIKTESKSDTKELILTINDRSKITKNKLKSCILSLSSQTNDHIIMYWLTPFIAEIDSHGDRPSVPVRFCVKNNEIYPCEVFVNNLKNYTLFPILASVFILTIVSAVSVNAITTKRQLRSYAIYCICGLEWRRCTLINFVSAVITATASMSLGIIILLIADKVGLLANTTIKPDLICIAVCFLTALVYSVISVILPAKIINSSTPNQILKSN